MLCIGLLYPFSLFIFNVWNIIIIYIQERTLSAPCASPTPENWMAQVKLPPHWIDVTFGAQDLRLCQVTYQDPTEATCNPLVVTRSLIVKQDHSWTLHVHGHLVDPANLPSLHSFPPTLTSGSTSLLLIELANMHTCIGNPERST